MSEGPAPTQTAADIFAAAAQELVAAGDIHRLFDLRLVERQYELGLPVGRRVSFDEVDDGQRQQLEAGYLAACREAGELLAEAGRVREAWMYLRPTGEKGRLRDRLARITATDDNVDELIETALFEGVDPERGFAWLLGRQGICSAITTLDGLQGQLSPAELRACATVLVRHVYGELRGNLRGHLHRLTGQAPPDASVATLVDQYPELTAAGDYHLDASHLMSTVRHARCLVDPGVARKALEIAQYGQRLAEDLQYRSDPPFEETYRAHELWFAATLGEQADAARTYFAAKAECDVASPGDLAAIETYVVLLDRIGAAGEALKEFARLVPNDAALSPQAPTLVELAARSGAWDEFEQICRERGDAVALAAGRVHRTGD